VTKLAAETADGGPALLGRPGARIASHNAAAFDHAWRLRVIRSPNYGVLDEKRVLRESAQAANFRGGWA
jgi:hypothetical protein